MTENERLQREIFSKEQLLISQEDANKSYVQHVRNEYREEINKYREEIETLSMEYQDLRELAVSHYNEILSLNKQLESKKAQLEAEIKAKNAVIQ